MIHSAACKVQKRKSLSGRENFLMVARDRCCQRELPVWKHRLSFASFLLMGRGGVNVTSFLPFKESGGKRGSSGGEFRKNDLKNVDWHSRLAAASEKQI